LSQIARYCESHYGSRCKPVANRMFARAVADFIRAALPEKPLIRAFLEKPA
jgi:hypothetical protein